MDLRCGECNVVSLYVLCCPANGSVCFVCCVFDSVSELFGKQFAICLGVFVILLLNVMELLNVAGVGYTMYGLPNSVCVVPVTPMSV